MKKMAISLPDDQAEAVERIRRRRAVPRSRVISEAIGLYLADEARREAVDTYVDGYRRIPEDDGEARAYAAAGSAAMGSEEWS